jgi:hypothetical protein
MKSIPILLMKPLQIHNALKRKYQGDVEKSAVIPTSKQIGNQKKFVLNIDDAIQSTSDLKEYLKDHQVLLLS